MIRLDEHITVRCPNCTIVIAGVTPETMVYCLACRKWCREVEGKAHASPPPPLSPKPRRIRCH